jgi:sirohydrochlorin ferrochelatase
MRHPRLTTAGGPAGPGRPVPPLVAVAHGSTDPRSAATIAGLMRLVRGMAAGCGRPGLDARTAYLGHAPPTVAQVLGALAGAAGPPRRAVVLPLLLTAAYHSEVDLPALVDEARGALPGVRISCGEPLGPDPLLLSALERRLAESGALAGPAGDIAVVLAAAGSRHPGANAAIARAAARWQAASGWRAVVPAYAAASSPAPGEAVAGLLRSGAPRVVVATYLLAPGVFADQVAASALRAGAAAVSGVLGAAPEIAEIILRRYAEALARPARMDAARPGDAYSGGGSCR